MVTMVNKARWHLKRKKVAQTHTLPYAPSEMGHPSFHAAMMSELLHGSVSAEVRRRDLLTSLTRHWPHAAMNDHEESMNRDDVVSETADLASAERLTCV